MCITATQLFFGGSFGFETCFYCGGKCEPRYASGDLVKSSFTGLDTVCRSKFVCGGCVACMDEKATIEMIDGTVRYGQKVRCYSWVVGDSFRYAATKSHVDRLAKFCVSPPDGRYAICLSESGQKHLLYRGVVNHDSKYVVATLEGDRIGYRPCELVDRLSLVKRVCAIVGKPSVIDSSTVQQMSLVSAYGDDFFDGWLEVVSEPLTRLALFLCPSKEVCCGEIADVDDRTGSTKVGGTY